MLCEYCSLQIEKGKQKCKKKVGLLNRCNNFQWSDVFWCKSLRTWASLEYCQYKVVNRMEDCTEKCKQRIELMATGHKYLDPFPYLSRLQKQYTRNLGEPKRKKLFRRKKNG